LIGYTYSCNIKIDIIIYDGQGGELKKLDTFIPYSIKHAEFDRTWYVNGLAWFTYNIGGFFGGIYNAAYFDPDIIDDFQLKIKDDYSNYLVTKIIKEIRDI